MRSTVAPMAKDIKTRWEGVYVRHRKRCGASEGRRCSCDPGYMARVWDRARGEQLRSPTFSGRGAAAGARQWRAKTLEALARGEMPDVRSDLRVGKAVDRFVEACRDGVALTKHGRRYKPKAIEDLDGALGVHVVPRVGAKRLSDVRRGDVQRIVDEITGSLSGSRVRTVVNALRSLYRWAQDRDLVGHNPAALVQLPAMDAKPRDRVATPGEFATLLCPLDASDQVAFALAGYATARRQELRLARWGDCDLELGVIWLGADSAGRKSDAALRLVPLVRPLRALLREEWLRQGRPGADALIVPARHAGSKSGLVSPTGIATRARQAWGWELVDGAWIRRRDDAFHPIGLHESRHTAASWMNAAGVNPKVASQIMGHATIERAAAAAAGAAVLTLRTYTHVLPGDLERARDQIDAYLAREMGVRDDAENAGL